MNNTHTDTHTHIHKQKLSLRPPDNGSCSSITNTPPNTPPITPPNTPVLNPNLLKTKHLSIDIPKWNDFDETNNQIPTIDVSPIYANNNPYSRKSTHHTNRKPDKIVYKSTYFGPDGASNADIDIDNRSCLIKILVYLFGGDSHSN
jgi:hypothetical protein